MLLAIYMQGSFGQYATTVGDAVYGLRLLQDAAGRLPRTAPPSARARLASLEAVSLSYLRDRAALKALDDGERYADASFHGDPVWPWVFQFDSSKIASYRSSRMPSVGVKIARRLATAITRASAVAAEPPAADLDQLLGERYPGEWLTDDFHQRCRDAWTVLRQMTHMGN